MKLIVGLGNPGKEYEKTRHNVGFMVLDRIAQQLGGEFCNTSKWAGDTFEVIVHGEKMIFVKPQTFMNKSGEAVGKFASYYKLEPKDVWVISDDIDLPLGKIRVREAGSSGGHNGLKSINQVLGTDEYYRIRVGVASKNYSEAGEPEASIFVLQPFDVAEQALLNQAIDTVAHLVLDSLEAKQLEAHTLTVVL